ncbi:SDR family oxidoreductase, partial [Lactococcus lactis]
MSPEIWDEVISVNLTGVFNSTHALLDKINQGGQIITLTSKSALFGNFGQANYAASKAGIIAFTKTLAKELQKSMIRVNSVSPAAVTDMTLPVLKSLKETYGQNIPDEWKMGSSSDVANFIINDLIESEMTGKIFSIHQGYSDHKFLLNFLILVESYQLRQQEKQNLLVSYFFAIL